MYNPNLGREESVALSHIYLTNADVLNQIKENIAKSLSHNWKTLLSFEMYDSLNGRVPNLYDFQDEILDQSRRVNTGVRCIEFTDLSKVFQTFVKKALKI